MKAAKIVLIIIVVGLLIHAIKGEATWPLPRVLPFSNGPASNWFYEVAGVIMICIAIWGICRLGRARSDHDATFEAPDQIPPDDYQDDAQAGEHYEDEP